MWSNGGFSLVFDVVMVAEQFSGGSVLISKLELSSSGSMSNCICTDSGSHDFNK